MAEPWTGVKSTKSMANAEDEFAERAQTMRVTFSKYFLEGLAVTARYDAKELAKLCNFSTRHLQREFKRRFQCSPQRWLDEQRIRAAQQLLLLGQPVKVVALELGFKSTPHFSRRFKSQFRMTPSEFTRSFQGVLEEAPPLCSE